MRISLFVFMIGENNYGIKLKSLLRGRKKQSTVALFFPCHIFMLPDQGFPNLYHANHIRLIVRFSFFLIITYLFCSEP